ncbi:plasmid replication protein, CyRepA1 family [Trichocoleus desertorum]|uniref:plasmid replication protein, CyRepA1 family n=1 Tax=Trichocoleus desertorum TaxID=1481672 RepID=UPI003299248B
MGNPTPASTPSLQKTQSGRFSQAAADHVQEWQESGVDLGIIALNVETLTDTATSSYADSLFPIAERLNWNITRFGQKPRSHLRGWWVSGVDPLNRWQPMDWGRFKPDAATPVLDRAKGKPAKYLSPSLGPGSSRLVLLDVPPHIWNQVAQRYNLAIAPEDRPLGFWHWVWENNVPVMLTEGEKKAGCLLTQGYAAIALPGIFNGYRRNPQSLIPELAHFATAERSVYICFDYETKPKTIRDLTLATTKLGKLLERAGCVVQVLSLPGPQKGVDDLIVAQGPQPFAALYDAALPLQFWLASQLWSLTYQPTLTIDTPYLGELPYPSSGLACIKSAKGTGKTTALQSLIRQATHTGRKVLVITHRIQLGRAICDSLGIDWIEEVKESDTQGLLGYGLCIDSLHPTSQARFNPQFWKGAIVILDEVEQVLWHALNSSTCYEQRVKILETLRDLVQVVLGSGGLIIAQDADLSDVSIDYLLGLAEAAIAPWIVVNQWRPETGWAVSFYDTKNPARLIARMEDFIAQGAVFVALDSQKVRSRWSSKNLETYLQSRYPDKRILRIDSESVADSQHPAYGMVERLNQAITGYDIVLATPTIGTGVSIDVWGHFKAVFGIFQGVTPDAESRQALARVREPVPRFIWAARFGPGKVGNGSCSYQDVIHSTTKAVKYSITLLKEVDFDLDAQTDPITLRSWAKMAARVNVSLWSYRNEFRNGLVMEGHQVTTVTDDLLQPLDETVAEQVVQDIKGIQEMSCLREAEAIASAPVISASEYERLKDQRAKTADERHAQHKYELERRYAIPITPELKIKDDEGWYAQLKLHYYLTHDPALVQLRDLKEWQGHLERGDGKVALQDVRLLTAQVETLKALGVLNLLNPEKSIRARDADVEQLRHHAVQYSHDLKAVLNLTISEKMTPIEVVQALLGKLGLKLTCMGRDVAPDGRRGGTRVYQYQPPEDGRETIFAQWQQRDTPIQPTQGGLAPSITIAIAPSDPPPDIYVSNQSAGGSNGVETALKGNLQIKGSQTGECLTPEQASGRKREEDSPQGPRIEVGSLVKRVQQACYWIVKRLEGATARLEYPHGTEEGTVPLNELRLVGEEGIP